MADLNGRRASRESRTYVRVRSESQLATHLAKSGCSNDGHDVSSMLDVRSSTSLEVNVIFDGWETTR
jgi:hypothetical protein